AVRQMPPQSSGCFIAFENGADDRRRSCGSVAFRLLTQCRQLLVRMLSAIQHGRRALQLRSCLGNELADVVNRRRARQFELAVEWLNDDVVNHAVTYTS